MKVDKSKWVETAFAEIATSQLGKTLDANKNKGLPYPYLCAANVGMGCFNLSNVKEILLEDSELEKYLVRKGDLLICEGGDTGRCSIWESEQPIYYQNALHRVRFNEDTHNKFIMYYLHYYKKVGVIDRLSHGQTIKHFTQKGLNKLSFKLPSLAIQQTIAKELDSIQEMIEGYKAQIVDLDELANSLFLDTFGDLIVNDKHWNITSFEETLVSIRTGLNPRDNFKLNEPGANNFYVTVKELDGYRIKYYPSTDKVCDYALPLINNRSNLEKGDVLFSGTGTIGRTAYVSENPKNWNIKEGVYVLKPNFNKINSLYLLHFLHSELVIRFCNGTAKGATIKSVPMKTLIKMRFPLPPLELQQKFATQVESIIKQKELFHEQLADAEQLMAERMQYYFS